MNQPLVSVVIPTYNHASFLKEAIRSVLTQTYSNIELIIVDNYSEDETEEVVRSFDDRRIRYFKFANQGVIAAARNHGIQQTKGTYVAFLDSDDLWLPEKLQGQVEMLEADPERGVSFCLIQTMSHSALIHEKIRGPKVKVLADNIYEDLIKSNFVSTSSAVVPKRILDEMGGFDEDRDLICSEDFDLWLRILHQYKPAFVNRIGVYYRIHVSNTSANIPALSSVFKVIDKHRAMGWLSESLEKHARGSYQFQIGWVLLRLEPHKARKFFKTSLRLSGRHFRLMCASLLGLFLTYIPGLYRWIQSNNLEQRLGKKFINSQNL